MKFCIFVILACIQTSLPLAQGQSIRDRIDELIQQLKNLIPEPVNFPDSAVALPENEYATGYLNVTNGTLSGLRDFNVNVDYRGVIIPIPTGFTINIHNLDSYNQYLSNLEVYNPSQIIYNTKGIFRTIATDVVIKGEIDFTLIPLSFTVTSLYYNVGGIQFDIQGIFSERFSQILSAILTNTVANTLNSVQEPVSAFLVDAINSIISGIFNEMNNVNVYPENVAVQTDQEKTIEDLGRFFDILERVLGLRSS